MFSWLQAPSPLVQRRLFIVAHRGSSAHAPGNTLAAFQRAITDGADAIELDVRFSKEKELVVFHDSRLNRRSDGSGPVREATLAEIKRLSAGAWYNRRFAQERIPTLSEVFDACGGKVGLNVELKADRRSRRELEIVDRCCSLIKRHRLAPSVLVSSFHHHFIRHLKQRYPEIPAALLFHPLKHLGGSAVRHAAEIGAEYMIFSGSSLRRFVVRRAHARGLLVGEFTVNAPHRLYRAVRYGVDAIITDDPARMQALLPARRQ